MRLMKPDKELQKWRETSEEKRLRRDDNQTYHKYEFTPGNIAIAIFMLVSTIGFLLLI